MVLFRVFFCMCISTILLVIWGTFVTRVETPQMISMHYFSKKPENIKYMLLWTPRDYAPFYYFYGTSKFLENNCSFSNCYVTDDRKYFGGDFSKFDAVAFNGRYLESVNLARVPRWPHQKFIYFFLESSANFFVNSRRNDGFFNWTSTYRLDSDIPYPYILIKNSAGNVVGPKPVMKWRDNMTEIDEEQADLLRKKTKLAVAFVSNCKAVSERERVLQKLSQALSTLGYKLDVYGECGTKKCNKTRPSCDHIVDEYYFYLAFENALSVDYVTEKLLRALHHNAIPIVFGGADYSRFLPPGSYLNARDHSAENLATIMIDLMKKPDRYHKFFGWKKYYTYHDPKDVENVCSLCEALNNKTKFETKSVYTDFRAWWNK